MKVFNFFNVKLLESEKFLQYNNIYEINFEKKLNEKFVFVENILGWYKYPVLTTVHIHIQLYFCSKIHFVEIMLHFNQNKGVILKSNQIAALSVTIHLNFNCH
jgi:hypothetical protein